MASNSEADTRLCVVWETNICGLKISRLFCLLDNTWRLKVSIDVINNFANCVIRLCPINQTGRDFATDDFGVTTFIEKIVPFTKVLPVLYPTFTSLPNLRTLNYNAAIWHRSPSEIQQHFPEFPNCEFRIVCLFHGVPSTTIQSKKETICLSTENLSCGFSTHHNKLSPNLENLSFDFRNLLEERSYSDVKLKCGDHTFPAHRAVLAARSEVFAAMFRNKMVESETGAVDITDLGARVLDLLLKYMYTGKIEVLPDDVLPSLYAAGDKYAVHALKKACSDCMICNLTEENCVNCLLMADAHSDATFKEEVILFICSHEASFQSDTWVQFSKNPSKLAMEVYQRFVTSISEK